MLLGSCVGQCNSAIAAGTAAQTTFNLRGSIGSGNVDHTPVSGELWLFATPTAGNGNDLTNVDIFQATAGTTTSITFASRTVVATRAVGDFAWVLATTTGPSAIGNVLLNNNLYVGLTTTGAQSSINGGTLTLPTGTITLLSTTGFPNATNQVIIAGQQGLQAITYTGTSGATLTGCTGGTGSMNTGDVVFLTPTAATILSNEPTSTGSYGRVAVINNAANWPASTASYPVTKTNGNAITFAQSTAAWSSGATALDIVFLADNSTLAGGNVLAWNYLTTPQTVNAASITPSFAASSLTWTLL